MVVPNNPYPNKYPSRFPARNPNLNHSSIQHQRPPNYPTQPQKIPQKSHINRRRFLIYAIIAVTLLIIILLIYFLFSSKGGVDDVVCVDDSECDTGYICGAGDCVLENSFECSIDGDCDYGEICQDGICVNTNECSYDFDCPSGKSCVDGVCVTSSLDCVDDLDCANGYVCEAGDCILDTNDPNGNICLNGTKRSCGNDVGECVKGNQTCFNGVWGNCTGAINPTNETCDGKDNDCDNSVDEGNICDSNENPDNNFSWGFTYDDIRTSFSMGEGVYVAGYTRNYSTPEPVGGIPGNVINYLTKGQIVGGPDNYLDPYWWKIKWDDGLEGWSHGDFLQDTEALIVNNVGDRIEVVPYASNLNIRSVPSASFTALGAKNGGEKGVVIAGPDKDVLRRGRYIWWKVNWTGLGETWISEDLIGKASDMPSIVSTKFVGGKNVTLVGSVQNIKMIPTSNLIIMGSKAPGSNGTIVGSPYYIGGRWLWRVNFKENVSFFGERVELMGWVDESSLYVPLVVTFSVGDRIRVKNATNNLAIRETPSQSATWLGGKNTGAIGNITGGPEFNEHYYWWKTRWDGGLEGWSVANYIELKI